ncbi:hypothetical protein EV715DRAFT_298351 [Schizophyllum commune]
MDLHPSSNGSSSSKQGILPPPLAVAPLPLLSPPSPCFRFPPPLAVATPSLSAPSFAPVRALTPLGDEWTHRRPPSEGKRLALQGERLVLEGQRLVVESRSPPHGPRPSPAALFFRTHTALSSLPSQLRPPSPFFEPPPASRHPLHSRLPRFVSTHYKLVSDHFKLVFTHLKFVSNHFNTPREGFDFGLARRRRWTQAWGSSKTGPGSVDVGRRLGGRWTQARGSRRRGIFVRGPPPPSHPSPAPLAPFPTPRSLLETAQPPRS